MSLDWLLRPQLAAFADAGFEVVAMSAPGPHVGNLTASGISHIAVPSLTRAMSPAGDLRAFRELHREFRRLRPDIVHTHNPKPGVLGRLAARAAGVPVVVNTVHGLYATVSGVLAAKGINILGSHVYTARSGLALEVYRVTTPPGVRVRIMKL